VSKALTEIDKNWNNYGGLIICGTHSPKNTDELIDKIKKAREERIPTLLICAGHQFGAIEYARNVLGIKDATSEEFGKGTFVVRKRPAMKIGLHEGESWWSNYEVDIGWEIPQHFISVPYHPEYQSSREKPHKLLVEFINKAKMKTQERTIWEIGKGTKNMLYEGFKFGTIASCLGKMRIIEDYSKKVNLKINYQYGGSMERTVMGRINYWIAYVLYSLFSDRILVKLLELPSFFYPVWYREIDGHKFTIREGEKAPVVKRILNDYKLVKSWEPNTQTIIRENVKRGDVVVDIGASMGPMALSFARQVGDEGKVIALEPTERCFNYLCQNIKANGYKNIFPYKVAGWDKNELVGVPVNDYNPIYANGVNVSDYLKKLGVEKVDFIKIDVDGPEVKVLRGLTEVFENNKNVKMIIEYYPKYIEGAGDSPEEFLAIIDKYFTYKKIEGDYGDGYWNLICERKVAV
jgi:FkbM family methyltransferase